MLKNMVAHGRVVSRHEKKIKKMQTKHYSLYGNTTFFGVMPDWNPAEIIGIKPKELSSSLYKELITNKVWAENRDNYGYKDIKSKENRINTESPGWVVDRMSILCLKIYHMKEQALRKDVTTIHLKKCEEKLSVLIEQQLDLSGAFDELLDDYESGFKKMKVYRQMKMYNDTSLSPELYQKKK